MRSSLLAACEGGRKERQKRNKVTSALNLLPEIERGGQSGGKDCLFFIAFFFRLFDKVGFSLSMVFDTDLKSKEQQTDEVIPLISSPVCSMSAHYHCRTPHWLPLRTLRLL